MEINNLIQLFSFSLLIYAFVGCDDGKLYPSAGDLKSEGRTVILTGSFSGTDLDGSGFYTVLAAFEEGNEFAAVSKVVGDGAMETVLSNVEIEKGTVELCVINPLRKRVFTLASVPVTPDSPDEIRMEATFSDTEPFSLISGHIFSHDCLQCHGGSKVAAAGLDLNKEKAYAMLVGVASTVEEGKKRVEQGHPEVSTLWEAVATDISTTWKFNHSNLLSTDKTEFIKYWISNLTTTSK